MYKNTRDLLGRLGECNKDFAGIFDDILKEMKELSTEVDPTEGDGGYFDKQITNRKKGSLAKDLGEAIAVVADRIGNINMIPGEPGNCCYPFCISKAFGKWNSHKYGFKGIAKKIISYWKSCAEINEITLIITFAWDELDFNQNFRKNFDLRTSNYNKTVCVILATSQGFSIQYLK